MESFKRFELGLKCHACANCFKLHTMSTEGENTGEPASARHEPNAGGAESGAPEAGDNPAAPHKESFTLDRQQVPV